MAAATGSGRAGSPRTSTRTINGERAASSSKTARRSPIDALASAEDPSASTVHARLDSSRTMIGSIAPGERETARNAWMTSSCSSRATARR